MNSHIFFFQTSYFSQVRTIYQCSSAMQLSIYIISHPNLINYYKNQFINQIYPFFIFTNSIIYFIYLTKNQQMKRSSNPNFKRCPCPRNIQNLSIQKITIVNSNNVKINNPPQKKQKNRSVDQIKKRYRSPSKKCAQIIVIQPKIFDVKEEMIKCRERQMVIIKKNIALLKYYNCLITLFMVTYTSCQVLISNFFQIRKKNCLLPSFPDQFGLNFVGLLIKVYETAQNYRFETKLRILAKNLIKISPTASDFEKKVQFIARKVALNNQKSKQIEMSFMNMEVQTFWQRLINKVFINSQIEFLQDMFELYPERLCVKNFQMLIEKYLCCEQFEKDLSYHNGFIDNTSDNHHFDIQFLLIEKICTQDYQYSIVEQPEEKLQTKKKRACQIY